MGLARTAILQHGRRHADADLDLTGYGWGAGLGGVQDMSRRIRVVQPLRSCLLDFLAEWLHPDITTPKRKEPPWHSDKL
jgi:hypothetical protein